MNKGNLYNCRCRLGLFCVCYVVVFRLESNKLHLLFLVFHRFTRTELSWESLESLQNIILKKPQNSFGPPSSIWRKRIFCDTATAYMLLLQAENEALFVQQSVCLPLNIIASRLVSTLNRALERRFVHREQIRSS